MTRCTAFVPRCFIVSAVSARALALRVDPLPEGLVEGAARVRRILLLLGSGGWLLLFVLTLLLFLLVILAAAFSLTRFLLPIICFLLLFLHLLIVVFAFLSCWVGCRCRRLLLLTLLRRLLLLRLLLGRVLVLVDPERPRGLDGEKRG